MGLKLIGEQYGEGPTMHDLPNTLSRCSSCHNPAGLELLNYIINAENVSLDTQMS